MIYITSNISQHTFQAKHRPLTPNTTQDIIISIGLHVRVMSNTLSTNQSNNHSSTNQSWKSKNIQIAHRQMIYTTSNIS